MSRKRWLVLADAGELPSLEAVLAGDDMTAQAGWIICGERPSLCPAIDFRNLLTQCCLEPLIGLQDKTLILKYQGKAGPQYDNTECL